MARQRTQVEFSDFTKGFITESSPLSFPENASIDEENININRDGSRQRRFGMTWQPPVKTISTLSNLVASGEAISSFTWRSAGNDGESTVGVLQIGRTLHFFDLNESSPANSYITSSTFTTLEVTTTQSQKPFHYTMAYGSMVLTVGSSDVWTFTWDGTTLTREDSYRVKIRDRFGIDDGLAVDERPTTADNLHLYNLKNQGWPLAMYCSSDSRGNSGGPSYTEPAAYTKSNMGFYPSNADLVYASRLAALHPNSNQVLNLGAYSPWELKKELFGSTQAPQGSFIIDAFTRGTDRATKSGLSGLPVDTTSGGISALSTFAGRLWYCISETGSSGTDSSSPNLGNTLFYSQATEDFSRWGACHSRNDPTAEEAIPTVASDGGFVSIPEAGEILHLEPLGESLFVLASNGIWEIFGGDSGFSATNQSVVKVSAIGALSNTSIVSGDSLIGYFSESGIYAITLDKSSLRGVSQSISLDTIQTTYDSIPIAQKREAIGSYDNISKQASWLYNTSPQTSSSYFTKELILDIGKGSFTKRAINTVNKTTGWGPYIVAHLQLRDLLQGTLEEVVTDGGNNVTDGGVDVTSTVSNAVQKTKSSTMYFIANSDGTTEDFRLGGYLDFNFVDYVQVQATDLSFGNDAPAFLLTGYITGGNSSIEKHLPYVTVKSKRTESGFTEDGSGNITMQGESSCTLEAQWQWTNNALAGKWTNPQEAYRLPRFITLDPSHIFSYDVVSTRNKIRGEGEAVSLKFSSSPGKDMHLLGWGVDVIVKKTFSGNFG